MKVGVNVAILKEGRVLLTRRKDFGVWCLPGGHVDQEESLAQAAVREAAEETGLDVQLNRLVGLYSIPKAQAWVNLIVLFAAEPTGGELRAQEDEVVELGYFGQDDVPQALLWGHRQRIRDVFSGCGGGQVWLQHAPYDPVDDRQALYALLEGSGLSGGAFYRRHFGWADPDEDRLEVGGTESIARQRRGMNTEPNDKGSKRPGSMMGVGIAIGAGIGVALGAAFDSLPIGIAVGVAVGVAIGAALEQHRKQSGGDGPAE